MAAVPSGPCSPPGATPTEAEVCYLLSAALQPSAQPCSTPGASAGPDTSSSSGSSPASARPLRYTDPAAAARDAARRLQEQAAELRRLQQDNECLKQVRGCVLCARCRRSSGRSRLVPGTARAAPYQQGGRARRRRARPPHAARPPSTADWGARIQAQARTSAPPPSSPAPLQPAGEGRPGKAGRLRCHHRRQGQQRVRRSGQRPAALGEAGGGVREPPGQARRGAATRPQHLPAAAALRAEAQAAASCPGSRPGGPGPGHPCS
jgi:hypothetical protein